MQMTRPWMAKMLCGLLWAAAAAVAAAPLPRADAAEPVPRAPASAASSTAERIAVLERTVDSLRGEARASREAAAQLRDQLTRAEEAGRWTWPLLSGVLLLVGLAAWLAWRLNSARRARASAWMPDLGASGPQPLAPAGDDAEAAPPRSATTPAPFVTSQLRALDGGRGRGLAPPIAPALASPPATATPSTEATQPFPRLPDGVLEAALAAAVAAPRPAASSSNAADAALRELSIEELLDLEQQADFFVVLGQDEAAVDLLVEHVRATGGCSPLPYLKLLEIFGRRGDRAEYERTRTRFNQRFNALAPEWLADLHTGRTLEDYPGVVPRLQSVWPRPLDAMAELEALLFRKSRGDLFELPAYRELLLLYSMARDLLDREAAGTGTVDLLLPLGDAERVTTSAPLPVPGPERTQQIPRPAPAEDRATVPVDLDLSSGHDQPASIFDTLEPLDEPAPRRR